MSDLGIFIDESGDVGRNSDFYIVSLVLHDQSHSIKPQLSQFERELEYLGFSSSDIIHAGPMMRRESVYKDMPLKLRRKAFLKMFSFVRLCDVKCKSLSVRKKDCASRFVLKGRLARKLGNFLKTNLAYFQSFESIIVYYDNGQSIVTDLINTVFSAYLPHTDVRRIHHSDYRLSQAADLICTLELLALKEKNGMGMTRSEEIFFQSRRKLNKVFLKTLSKMRFD